MDTSVRPVLLEQRAVLCPARPEMLGDLWKQKLRDRWGTSPYDHLDVHGFCFPFFGIAA